MFREYRIISNHIRYPQDELLLEFWSLHFKQIAVLPMNRCERAWWTCKKRSRTSVEYPVSELFERANTHSRIVPDQISRQRGGRRDLRTLSNKPLRVLYSTVIAKESIYPTVALSVTVISFKYKHNDSSTLQILLLICLSLSFFKLYNQNHHVFAKLRVNCIRGVNHNRTEAPLTLPDIDIINTQNCKHHFD